MTRSRACALALLLAVLATAAGGCGGGGAVGRASLAKQSEAVQSLAAEGALLAEDAAAGRSTGIFREQHSAELAKAAATVERSLESARTDEQLRPELRRLRSLAERVRVDLGRLGSASTAEQRTLARRLEGAASESEKVGEELA